jgi:CheY-like chemotaxis protein
MNASRTILLVEDNEDDIFFMKRALAAAGMPETLEAVTDGQAAIDFLGATGPYAHRQGLPPPALTFLDLKLPRRPGLEVLAWMRQQPALKTNLVLVLTSSREESDVRNAYRLGANSYLVKPPNGQELADLMKRVKAYWLDNPQLALPAA